MNLLEIPAGKPRKMTGNNILCPLCSSHVVEYEFVVERLAYSRCRDCSLLFANPSFRELPAAIVAPETPAVVRVALDVASRCTAMPFERIVLVSDAASVVDGMEVVTPAALIAGSARYDAIAVVAAIERSDDPYALFDALSRSLTDGGRLIVLFPCLTSADALSQRDRWAPFRQRTPLLFSVDTLQSMETRCGFGEFLSVTDTQDSPSPDSATVRRWFASHAVLISGRSAPRESRKLSVIFPVYNEAPTVEASLERVLNKDIPGVEMEIIIVESNSTDGSRDIVGRYAHHPKVRIVHEERPRGKGHAVRTGLEHASGEVIVFQDADLEYDVDDYDALVAPLFELRRNFVLGSRHNARGTAWKIRHFDDQPGMSSVANFAHLLLLALFNGVHGTALLDPFTMYKVFRRDCLYGLAFEDDRFDFDHEINIKLIRKGYRPVEIPVNYNSRSFKEGKKIAIFRDPPTWVRSIVRHKTTRLYPFVEARTAPPFRA